MLALVSLSINYPGTRQKAAHSWQKGVTLSHWFDDLSHWFVTLSHWFVTLPHWFVTLPHWFDDLSRLASSSAVTDIYICLSFLSRWERIKMREQIINIFIFIFNYIITLTPTISLNGKEKKVDVSDLVTGVYFVRVDSKMYRFVKM